MRLALVVAALALAPARPEKIAVYVGSYSPADKQGIHVFQLDLASGALAPAGGASGAANPSFLAVHPNRRFLYAVAEVASAGGKPGGGVAAFSIDPKSGALALLNTQPSEGAGPCHIVVDRDGKNVLVANYGGGSVAVLPIRDDGRLAPPSAAIQHQGSSVNPSRQKAPHAHSINLDPAGRFAFAADLGLDKVLIYRFDSAKGSLVPNEEPSAPVAPGAGPRHFAFHPSGRFAYVINEMANTVTAFAYDAGRGALKEIQTQATLPADFKGTSHTAEVQVHPSGKFVYGSNRGHDSIAVFTVDAATGRLAPGGQVSTRGKTPRNFGIDPTGAWLLAANQGSDTIVVFKIDPATGGLTPTEHSVSVPKPVCVKFAPPEK